MIGSLLQKVFGTRNDRQLKKLWPEVERINRLEEPLQKLSDAELRAKTEEFRTRLREGETTDDIMHEAFAVVKNCCRRLCGRTITVTGQAVEWQMIPYDVQLLGATALHRANIAEMATGEGKTLVATMPLYLNSLTGRNCQLVTVNDYLARRDAEWMGAVYEFLGVTVGCIQHDQRPDLRRAQYACDITYGTNSEFGFDYLRDMGMAMSTEEMVQRDHFYVIVDEIDSILIDEARTPLIISGPADRSTHKYDELKPTVHELFRKQTVLCTKLAQDAKAALETAEPGDNDYAEAILRLIQVQMGMPKHKQLMRLAEDPVIRKAMDRKDHEVHSDANRGYLQQVREELYYSLDERGGQADLTELGRKTLNPKNPDAFVIPDIAAEFSVIDGDEALSEEERARRRMAVQSEFDVQNEKIHNISQLLRAYTLFERDVQYVVQENKVIIVDEFTGRLMPGRRYGDGLHQALEAKEGVAIERETQTLASITIQNYFRMYERLAGMTGTAETEAQEFRDIYGLEVVVVPTNRPCQRIDNEDQVYKTTREKYAAVVEEVAEAHKRGQPVLVGTVSVDVSEILSRMLQRQRIPHNVLNAKNHQREAEIVARAGQRGAVTIATNMAGRGTDIKLGEGVPDLGGLHVIGSARHEARRIDRQLRGRCARQGDPGSSRFYVALEDNLMRLFGSDRMSSLMERIGMEDDEHITGRMLSRAIEGAQRKVEQHHFSMRKRTLQYDDVMNRQREVLYGLRRDVLTSDDPREKLFEFVNTAVFEHVQGAFEATPHGEAVQLEDVRDWLTSTFPVPFPDEDLQVGEGVDVETVTRRLVNRIEEAYAVREKLEEPELLRWAETQVMLTAIDRPYQEHLYTMDDLRQGVQLRAYGQRDPLVEYKREAHEAFEALMGTVNENVVSNMFRSTEALARIRKAAEAEQRRRVRDNAAQFEVDGDRSGGAGEPQPQPDKKPIVTIRRQVPKVGRNDPCPCGSGKKFKHCCGRHA